MVFLDVWQKALGREISRAPSGGDMSQDPLDQAVLGVLISSAPWWAEIFHALSSVAAFVCVMTGAIIGLHGVYRIFRPRRQVDES